MSLHNRLVRAVGIALLLLLTSAAPHAWAEVITIPLSAFSGGEQVVQFNVATPQPLPYSEDGATFLPYTGFLGTVALGNIPFLTLAGSGTLRVTFSDAVTMAGFDFLTPSPSAGPAGISAEVFADLQGLETLGQVSFGSVPPLQRQFLGFAAGSPFSRADITFAVQGPITSFVIDDFRFDSADPIPEPGTITLTLVGLGWLGSRMRRRARAGRPLRPE